MDRSHRPYMYANWKEFHESKRKTISTFYSGFDQDVLNSFYSIGVSAFDDLLRLYQGQHGASAAAYARRTYPKWKSGETMPSGQTVERLLMLFPRVLPFSEKCELLRKLRERHRKRERHSLKVNTDNWAEAVTPLVRQLISKSYTSQPPQRVMDRLTWLSSGDTQAAQAILAEVEAQTGRNAVRLLRYEFDNMDRVLRSLPVRGRLTHSISLPYGEIRLRIRRAKKMPDDKISLPSRDKSLFRPTARDILDNAFTDLDESQAKAIKEKAAQEALQIEVDRARTEIRFDNASREMDNVVSNARNLDQTVQEYDLRSTIESASGTTQVHIRRNRTQTQIIWAILIILCLALLFYLTRR